MRTLLRLVPRLDPIMARHALRTALASVLTLVLVDVFSLPQGYWAVISAIIVMQANLGRSLMSGLSRVQGTFIGALLGALTLSVMGTGTVSLGLGVFLTIFVCAYFMGLHESFRLAAVTASIVILLGRGTEHPFLLGLDRFLEISLGVAVAMAVSMFVLPFHARTSLRLGIRAALEASAQFVTVLLGHCLENRYDEPAIVALKNSCIRHVMQLRPALADAAREPGGLGEGGQVLGILTASLDRLMEDFQAMDHAARELAEEALHLELRPDLAALARAMHAGLTAAAGCLGEHGVRRADMRQLMEALENTLHSVDRGMEGIRARQIARRHPLSEVTHFFSLVFSMREAALELMEMLAALHEVKR
ncbi:MAG: FUSC family protein [Desulfovibrio sp.]|nr:FUSC family protein [Desulfovibrio sp.]